MYLRWIAQNRPRVIGSGELQPDVFRESALDDLRHLLEQMLRIDQQAFSLHTP